MSDHTVNVLDHGLVRLVSYTQPAVQRTTVYQSPQLLEMLEIERLTKGEDIVADYSDWTGDLEIIRNARVSYDAAWRAGEDEGRDTKLLRYLMKNRHTSPFEAMSFTFEVKAPIFVIRQWHRHRTWAYSEVSARYTELPELFYVPIEANITTQSTDNKQMRTTVQHPHAVIFQELMRAHHEDAFRLYHQLLEEGCPRELARTVLPLATYTHMFASVNLHNLLHFCGLRMHEHAQLEIRVYAEAMLSLVEPICPVAVASFKEFVLGLDTTPRTVTAVAKGMRKHF